MNQILLLTGLQEIGYESWGCLPQPLGLKTLLQ